MTFGEFLDRIDGKKGGGKGGGGEEEGEGEGERLYLTTQNVTTDDGGRPRVMSNFMRKLADDFPLRPAIAGNLVPQNVNVWMGRTKGGSSSGLHHDYHDNLYIPVEGRKKFDLYAPSDAPFLYTRGTLRRIHPNGRINYRGEETLGDGSHPGAERALDASLRQDEALRELEEAERAKEKGEEGAEERLREAERALEAAMEEVMDAEENEEGEVEEDDGDDDDDDDEGAPDDDASAPLACQASAFSGEALEGLMTPPAVSTTVSRGAGAASSSSSSMSPVPVAFSFSSSSVSRTAAITSSSDAGASSRRDETWGDAGVSHSKSVVDTNPGTTTTSTSSSSS